MNLEEYRKDIYKCIRCGFCKQWDWNCATDISPIVSHTSGWETHYARGKIWQLKMILENVGRITDNFLERFFLCTLCGSCSTHCPMELPIVEMLRAGRNELDKRGLTLAEHEALVDLSLALNTDMVGSSRPHPTCMTETDPPKTAEVLYYPGCTSMYKLPQNVETDFQLLQKLGVDFTWLGVDEESCCGLPFAETGQIDAYRELAIKTINYITSHKPKLVITPCPGCFKFLKKDFRDELGLEYGFMVQHTSEFLSDRVANLSLGNLDKSVAWHDPCVLGRQMDVYEAPRKVLNSIPGLKLMEIYPNKDHSICCGAGGGVGTAFPVVSQSIAKARLNAVNDTNADTLATACPGCQLNFNSGANDNKYEFEVRDLNSILLESLRNR